MQTDFNFTVGLFTKFFDQEKIQQALTVIDQNKITGWELWWQIEFAAYLANHPEKHEWYREQRIDLDRRREKEKSSFAPDFMVRPKNHTLDKFILLEFKQHLSPKSCITNMVKDVVKVDKAKKSALDIRSLWVVGVHRWESEEAVLNLVEAAKKVHELELAGICAKQIPNTNWAFTIF